MAQNKKIGNLLLKLLTMTFWKHFGGVHLDYFISKLSAQTMGFHQTLYFMACLPWLRLLPWRKGAVAQQKVILSGRGDGGGKKEWRDWTEWG